MKTKHTKHTKLDSRQIEAILHNVKEYLEEMEFSERTGAESDKVADKAETLLIDALHDNEDYITH